MNIAIDTFETDHGKSGTGSYVLYFVSAAEKFILQQEGAKDKFFLFGAQGDKFLYTSGHDVGFDVVKTKETLKKEAFWHFFWGKRFCKKYDAVIFPAVDKLPLCAGVPSIAVVNAILPLDCPEGKRTIERLKRATHIITATKFLMDGLVQHGISQDKISVVYNGIDHTLFYPQTGDKSIADIKPFAVARPYFVYASRLSTASKKHIELIRAFDIFKEHTRAPHRLVLAGSSGEYASSIYKAVFEAKYASEILLTGFFPHQNFAELCAFSDGCVFPSTIEGVGLPVLEAMAAGVPVACSREGALNEVAQDCAIYFDSNNVDDIAKAMEQLATNKTLRQTLIKKGIVRANDFNWTSTVQQTFDIAHKIIGR